MNRPHNRTTAAIMLSIFDLTNCTLVPALSLTALYIVNWRRWGFTCCVFCRSLTRTWSHIQGCKGLYYMFVLRASAVFHQWVWPALLPHSEPRAAVELKRYEIIRSPQLFPSLFPSITIVCAKWDLRHTQQSLLIQLQGLAAARAWACVPSGCSRSPPLSRHIDARRTTRWWHFGGREWLAAEFFY